MSELLKIGMTSSQRTAQQSQWSTLPLRCYNTCWSFAAPPPHPLTQFTHQSNNLTACQLSRTASWLVLQRCILTASDFYRSRMPNWCSRYIGYVCTRVAAVYLALVLSPTMGDRKDHSKCLWSCLWVVCHQHCLLRRHNYCAPSGCVSSACRRSASHQPDEHLGTRLGDYASSLWGFGGWDVDNLYVWIIRNCRPNYWKQKKNSISVK